MFRPSATVTLDEYVFLLYSSMSSNILTAPSVPLQAFSSAVQDTVSSFASASTRAMDGIKGGLQQFQNLVSTDNIVKGLSNMKEYTQNVLLNTDIPIYQKADPMLKFLRVYSVPIAITIFLIITAYIYFTVFYNRIERGLKQLRYYATIVDPQPVNEMSITNIGDFRLCDFYVSSSYKSYLPKNKQLDYSSYRAIEAVLLAGARFVDLDVYPATFCSFSEPVVCNGSQDHAGLYSYTTQISFDKCIEVIRNVAFSKNIRNYGDPLFLNLNIYPNENYQLLKKIADILNNRLSQYMLKSGDYHHSKDFATKPIRNFYGKVIILCNRSWRNSPLDEIINISHLKIRVKDHETMANIADKAEPVNYNKQNLTVIYPSFKNPTAENYNPSIHWVLGCQFVCMNFQSNDKYMDFYIDRFQNASFILKPRKLRYRPELIPAPRPQNPAVSYAPKQTTTPFYSITY